MDFDNCYPTRSITGLSLKRLPRPLGQYSLLVSSTLSPRKSAAFPQAFAGSWEARIGPPANWARPENTPSAPDGRSRLETNVCVLANVGTTGDSPDQSATEGALVTTFQGIQDAARHQFTWIRQCLRVFGHATHVVVHKIEQSCEGLWQSSGWLLAGGLVTLAWTSPMTFVKLAPLVYNLLPSVVYSS
jgi:hypothetical protein